MALAEFQTCVWPDRMPRPHGCPLLLRADLQSEPRQPLSPSRKPRLRKVAGVEAHSVAAPRLQARLPPHGRAMGFQVQNRGHPVPITPRHCWASPPGGRRTGLRWTLPLSWDAEGRVGCAGLSRGVGTMTQTPAPPLIFGKSLNLAGHGFPVPSSKASVLHRFQRLL